MSGKIRYLINEVEATGGPSGKKKLDPYLILYCAFESTEDPVTKQTLIWTRSEVRPGLCICNELSGNDGKVAKPWA